MEGVDSLANLVRGVSFAFSREKIELFDDNNDAELDEGYLEMLIDRERSCEPLLLRNYLKEARLKAITWILKTRAAFGFRFQTAYLSIVYFDRFLSRRSTELENEKPWMISLASIASLTLAAKMEESRVPAVSLSRFRTEDYVFGSENILRMEVLVLNTLGWKMDSVTPFVFLRFFVKDICKTTSPSDDLISSIIHLIFSAKIEVNVFGHRPSVIAISSIYRAMDQKFTKMSCMPCCGFVAFESVFYCCNLMQTLKIPKSNLPDLTATEEDFTFE